ncbi:hypothetical protein GCM10027422_43370 [Hymenobacter arcticus]
MDLLRKLLDRYPVQTVGAALALGLALAGLWSFLHYTPASPEAMSRARVRRTTAEITTHRTAVAADTPIANAAHAAAHQLLDTARQHARRAIRYHQLATTPPTTRHAQKPPLPPLGPAAAEQLQRQLTDQLR